MVTDNPLHHENDNSIHYATFYRAVEYVVEEDSCVPLGGHGSGCEPC